MPSLVSWVPHASKEDPANCKLELPSFFAGGTVVLEGNFQGLQYALVQDLVKQSSFKEREGDVPILFPLLSLFNTITPSSALG